MAHSREIIEKARALYVNGGMRVAEVQRKLREEGIRLHHATLHKWCREERWDEDRTRIETEVRQKAQDEVIAERAAYDQTAIKLSTKLLEGIYARACVGRLEKIPVKGPEGGFRRELRLMPPKSETLVRLAAAFANVYRTGRISRGLDDPQDTKPVRLVLELPPGGLGDLPEPTRTSAAVPDSAPPRAESGSLIDLRLQQPNGS